MNKELVESYMRDGIRVLRVHLAWMLVDLFVKKGTHDFNALYLRFGPSYGAACVLASIDEWGECILSIAAT